MRGRAAFGLMLAAAVIMTTLTSLYRGTEDDLPDPGTPAVAVMPSVEAAPRVVHAEAAVAIPVEGVRASDLVDGWGQSRAQERLHRALDIAAPVGTPVIAAMDGRIEKLLASDRGGHTIYQRSTDGRLMLYYAHLQGYRRGLAEGDRVRRGQILATVGASGNADPAFPHLHFQMLKTMPDADWDAGEPVNPYPLLAGRTRARQ